jgi:hypothetical protein
MIVRYALAYGAALALLVEWLAWQHALRFVPTESFIIVVAVLFAAIGLWLGRQLVPHPHGSGFLRNHRARDSLGISPRAAECSTFLPPAGRTSRSRGRWRFRRTQ